MKMKLYAIGKGRKFGTTFRVKGEVFEAPRNLAKIWKAIKYAADAPADAVVGTVIGEGEVHERPKPNIEPRRKILGPIEPPAPPEEPVDPVPPDEIPETGTEEEDAIDDADTADADDGKQAPGHVGDKDLLEDDKATIKRLREEYMAVFDKRPFPGWDAEKLQHMIAEEKKARSL